MSDRPGAERHPSFYRSSRTKTIVSVVVSVVALSLAGLLAGALAKPADDPLVGAEIGGGTGSDVYPPPIAFPQVQASSSPAAGSSPAPSPSVEPSAVPSVEPSAIPSSIPSASPAAPSPSPSPTAGGPGAVLLVGVPLVVEIPAPWELTWLHDNGTEASFSSGAGDFVYIAAGIVQDPARGAAAYVPEILDRYLPPEYYTQRELGEVQVQEPFGSLSSMASIPYRALWVDSQSSFPVRGNLWMVIRQDGKAVVMTAESTPEEQFAAGAWRAIVDPTVNSFANPDV